MGRESAEGGGYSNGAVLNRQWKNVADPWLKIIRKKAPQMPFDGAQEGRPGQKKINGNIDR